MRSAYSYLCYIPDFGRVRSIYPNAAAPHKPPFDMTEFGLIDTIRDMFAAIPRNGFDGIGDDCTVFPLGSGESLVFTADLLAENIHFLRRATSARELGRKSLAVNLSDVAAMGARPIATLLSLAIPHDLPEGWIEDFMEGYRDLSAQYDVGLVGGDHSTPYGLVQALGEAIDARVYLVTDYPSPEDALEQAAADGAQVVFTTTVPLIFACRKLAPKYPGVRFLNCSVDMPYPGVRTYYSRIYEAKFLLGALAGTLAEDARIGYVADAPVFGTPAAINAFALGAQLTRPDAQILLRWSCCEQEPAAALAAEGLGMICAHDLKRPGQENGWRGLCRVEDGKPRREALPIRNWGEIYIRLARSILRGGWDELSAAGAVNYWWGFASGAVDVQLAPSVPDGPRELLRVLREALVHGELTPFHRRITDQEGTLRNDGEQWFSPETILRMDWLCSNVTGKIPDYEELLPMAQPMVRLLGVYRDALQPKKRGPLL